MDPTGPLTIDHIVVPLDGSQLAEVTIEPAITLADRLRARITLLHVLERRAPATVHNERHLTGTADAETYLQGVAARLAAAGIAAEHHIPSIVKAKEIISSGEFGQPCSLTLRYPQSIPPLDQRGDLTKVRGLLDHIYHPASIIHELMGPVETFSYQWEPISGGTVTNLTFVSGAIGTLHMPGGGSGSSPLERLEVVGEHANVVVDNGVRVTYYRPAQRPAYGRSASYLVDNDVAPLFWEPEFSLGQLYNKNIFFLGYVQEVLRFCDSVLNGTPPLKGTLEQAVERDTPLEGDARTGIGDRETVRSLLHDSAWDRGSDQSADECRLREPVDRRYVKGDPE